jgi:hypothetical protein
MSDSNHGTIQSSGDSYLMALPPTIFGFIICTILPKEAELFAELEAIVAETNPVTRIRCYPRETRSSAERSTTFL